MCFLFHFAVKWIIIALSVITALCFSKKENNKDIALVVFSLHKDFLCLLNIKFVVQEKERRQRVPFLEEESNNCKYNALNCFELMKYHLECVWQSLQSIIPLNSKMLTSQKLAQS